MSTDTGGSRFARSTSATAVTARRVARDADRFAAPAPKPAGAQGSPTAGGPQRTSDPLRRASVASEQPPRLGGWVSPTSRVRYPRRAALELDQEKRGSAAGRRWPASANGCACDRKGIPVDQHGALPAVRGACRLRRAPVGAHATFAHMDLRRRDFRASTSGRSPRVSEVLIATRCPRGDLQCVHDDGQLFGIK